MDFTLGDGERGMFGYQFQQRGRPPYNPPTPPTPSGFNILSQTEMDGQNSFFTHLVPPVFEDPGNFTFDFNLETYFNIAPPPYPTLSAASGPADPPHLQFPQTTFGTDPAFAGGYFNPNVAPAAEHNGIGGPATHDFDGMPYPQQYGLAPVAESAAESPLPLSIETVAAASTIRAAPTYTPSFPKRKRSYGGSFSSAVSSGQVTPVTDTYSNDISSDNPAASSTSPAPPPLAGSSSLKHRPAAKKARRTPLTAEEKKANHNRSEQRRRELTARRFDGLCRQVPVLKDYKVGQKRGNNPLVRKKADAIHECGSWVEMLRNCLEQLTALEEVALLSR